MKKIALVTGANRGIGLEAARQMKEKDYEVILTSRNPEAGEVIARDLGLPYHPLDVASTPSIAALISYVENKFGRLDVLINNAGVLLDRHDSILDLPEDKLRSMFDINTFGPLNLAQAFLPMMLEQNYGRIVNVSSGMGRIDEMENYAPAYRLTKLTLNGITLILADAVKGKNVLINAVCPGWVRTDMGGSEASRDLPTGGRSVVWAATLPDDGPHGGFFRDGEALSW